MLKITPAAAVLILLLGSSPLFAQDPPAPPAGQPPAGRGPMPRMPPLTLNTSRVVAPGATVEKVAAHFIFTEGTTSDNAGNVYFGDQDNIRIMKYDTAGTL